MWKLKELKKQSRGSLRRNYWRIVIICLAVTFLSGMFGNFATISQNIQNENIASIVETGRHEGKTNTQIIDEFLNGGEVPEHHAAPQASRGILAGFINNITKANSLPFGVLNAFNQFFFNDEIGVGITIAIGVLLGIVYWILVIKVLEVGRCRYFLETRTYSVTPLNRFLLPYRIRRTWNVAKTMCIKEIFLALWCLTIVGGIIKFYSYRMVPYILAENPDLSTREVIKLSRKMMDGNKWRTFLMDFSFLGWYILSMLTFNVLTVLLITPYRLGTEAELYIALRKQELEKAEASAEAFKDSYLDLPVVDAPYPEDAYFIQIAEKREWLKVDYRKSYSLSSLVLMFFTFSFIGWAYEVGLFLYTNGEFINRGVLFGPWLPIYGAGGALILILLQKVRDKPMVTFLLTMLIAGIVEFSTSFYLEVTKGMRWWDYSGYFLNLDGRICLEGLIVFGLGGLAAVYFIAPMLDNLYTKIPKKTKTVVCIVLILAFSFDAVYSLIHPNIGDGITDNGVTVESTQDS